MTSTVRPANSRGAAPRTLGCGLALMLAFSPAERLAWATHFMIANLLVFAMMWGWLCEYVATAMLYWRDRRGAA